MTCLSVRQIEQIENGESSSFYGTQVKFTAAKKVAALLKLKPKDAFEFSGLTQTVSVSDAKETLKEESVVSVGNKNTPNKTEESLQVKVVKPITAKSGSRKIPESVADYRARSQSTADPKRKIFLLVAIAAAIIFSLVNLRPLFFPEPVKEEVVIIQDVAPEPPPASVPAEPPRPRQSQSPPLMYALKPQPSRSNAHPLMLPL